jgi:hypothetical protein
LRIFLLDCWGNFNKNYKIICKKNRGERKTVKEEKN